MFGNTSQLAGVSPLKTLLYADSCDIIFLMLEKGGPDPRTRSGSATGGATVTLTASSSIECTHTIYISTRLRCVLVRFSVENVSEQQRLYRRTR